MANVCAIVGVGPGLGTALGRRFGREGYAVGGIARKDATLAAAKAELSKHGVRNHLVAADAANEPSLKQAFAEIDRALGAPSVLIYNASVLRPGHPSRVSAESLVADFKVNTVGALIAAQCVLDGMRREHEGTILFTGGGLALHPVPEYASLGVGKAGIRSLALVFAKELAPDGIHAATVTVCGTIEKGTRFDPDAIAEEFWRLHDQPRNAWQPEHVFE